MTRSEEKIKVIRNMIHRLAEKLDDITVGELEVAVGNPQTAVELQTIVDYAEVFLQ
jgi:hypothetical protein